MPFIFIYKDRYKIIISYLCCFLIFCPNNSSLSLFHHLSSVQETFLLVKIFCVFIFSLFHISPLPSPYLPSLPPLLGPASAFHAHPSHWSSHLSGVCISVCNFICKCRQATSPVSAFDTQVALPGWSALHKQRQAQKDGSVLTSDESGKASSNRCVSWWQFD